MVAQEEEKTVGRTGDEGNCHEYIEGKKEKKSIDISTPHDNGWCLLMDPNGGGQHWLSSSSPKLYIYSHCCSFSSFFFFSWKYLAQANSLPLYVFPSNIDQHLAKYTYTSVLYGWKWRKKYVWWSVVPRISSLVSSFKSTDAFIHKLLPCSVFSFLTI